MKRIFMIALAITGITFALASCDTTTGGNTNEDSELSGTITISPDSGVAPGDTLSAAYSGSESVSYRWNKDGSAISPAETGTSYIPEEAGSYTVTVSAEGYKSKISAAVTVTGSPLPELSGAITISPASGVTGTQLTAAYIGGENVSFRWNKDDFPIEPEASGNTYTPEEAGSYTVTVRMEGRKSKTSAPVIIAIAINSLEQLNAISAAANNYAGLRKNYKLTADISGVTTPIGAVSGGRFVPFTGDFDGNGHTVTVNITSGLTIPSGPLAGTYAGLFAAAGELSGDPGTRGTIHDLKVSGTINIKISADRMLCAGGVVGGMLPTASVSKVVSSVDVSASGKGMAAAGGIAGGLQGGTVSNASASGNISATTTSTSDDIRAHAGGIAGAVMGAVVSRVYATGNVSATSSGDDAQAGGVVGSADDDSDVNNVYATGNVSATGNGPEAHARAGGVMGNIHNGGTLSYAYATGDISVTVSTKSGQAAGIVGNLDPGSVRNTVALNGSISISGTSYEKAARRVIGRITGTMADNYGKADLTPSGGSGSMDKGANRQDGEDVAVTGGPLPTAYTAPNENWWKNTAWSGADWTTVWQWDSAKGLPVLR